MDDFTDALRRSIEELYKTRADSMRLRIEFRDLRDQLRAQRFIRVPQATPRKEIEAFDWFLGYDQNFR
jgi:hypothetical protein